MITRTTGSKTGLRVEASSFPNQGAEDARPTTTFHTLMRVAEICLNKCQIPRLHIVCQRSFDSGQKKCAGHVERHAGDKCFGTESKSVRLH